MLLSSFLALGLPTPAQNSGSSVQPAAYVTILDSTKAQDGLIGSVRRVQTETAKLEPKAGSLTEGQRQLLEVTTYNLKGNRIDNASYPLAGSPIGKEEYKYDRKGNIVEMTLRGDDGSIISRETYKYEFDDIGNWTKMVTSLVVFEGGELRYEPVEVTYRTITYYYDQTVAKIVGSRTSETNASPPASRKPLVSEFKTQQLSLSKFLLRQPFRCRPFPNPMPYLRPTARGKDF